MLELFKEMKTTLTLLTLTVLFLLFLHAFHGLRREAVEDYKQYYFNAECEEYLKNKK